MHFAENKNTLTSGWNKNSIAITVIDGLVRSYKVALQISRLLWYNIIKSVLWLWNEITTMFLFYLFIVGEMVQRYNVAWSHQQSTHGSVWK